MYYHTHMISLKVKGDATSEVVHILFNDQHLYLRIYTQNLSSVVNTRTVSTIFIEKS